MAFRFLCNRQDPLTQLDDEDDMSPEDEAIGMAIPDGFRLQESRSAALDNSFVKRGVLVRPVSYTHLTLPTKRIV